MRYLLPPPISKGIIEKTSTHTTASLTAFTRRISGAVVFLFLAIGLAGCDKESIFPTDTRSVADTTACGNLNFAMTVNTEWADTIYYTWDEDTTTPDVSIGEERVDASEFE